MSSPSRSRANRSNRGSSIGVNLASMIDVVFLLLIYFMVATDFRPGEQVFRLDLPQRGEGLYEELFDQAEEPLLIRLGVSSQEPGYRLLMEGGWGNPRDIEALGRFMSTHRIGGGGRRDQGWFTSDHPIVILAEPAVSWSMVVGAFNAVAGAGYDVVSLEVN